MNSFPNRRPFITATECVIRHASRVLNGHSLASPDDKRTSFSSPLRARRLPGDLVSIVSMKHRPSCFYPVDEIEEFDAGNRAAL